MQLKLSNPNKKSAFSDSSPRRGISKEARRKLHDRFARQAYCSGKMVLEHFASHKDDPSALDLFRNHLCHAIDINYKYTNNQNIVVDCALIGHDYMMRRGPWSLWIKALTQAIDIAYQQNDSSACAKLHYCVGNIYSRQGNLPQARTHLRKAEALYKKLENLIWLPRIWHRLSCAYHYCGDWAKADELAHQALNAQEKNGDAVGLAATCSSLGNYAWHRSDYHKAILRCQRALSIPEIADDPDIYALTHNRLGLCYYIQFLYEDAERHFCLGKAIAEEANDDATLGTILSNLGLLKSAVGEYQAALKILTDALQVAERCGNGQCLGFIYLNLGQNYTELEELTTADRYYQDAIHIAQQHGNRHLVASSYICLAQNQQLMAEYENAEASLSAARQTVTGFKDLAHLNNTIREVEKELASARDE